MQKFKNWLFSIPFVAKYGFKLFVWWVGVRSELKRWFCRHHDRKTIFVSYQDMCVHEKCNSCGADIYTDY